MIIFLYGPDDYRRRQKEKWFVSEYEKKHSVLGIGSFDLEAEEGFLKFQEFARSESLFDPAKLIILDNVFESEIKDLSSELKNLAEIKSATVLISEPKKPTKEFNFLIKKPVLFQEFGYLNGYEWEMFIKKEAEKLGVKLTDEAVRFLSEVHENDTWRVVTEIQKLSFWGKKAISVEDLKKIDLEITPNFWNLLSAFKDRDIKKRLTALERVFVENEPAAKLFHTLAYQLPGKINDFADYDLAVKSGKMDYEEALVSLILE